MGDEKNKPDFRAYDANYLDPEKSARDARMLHWALRILALGLVLVGLGWWAFSALTSP